MPLDELSSANNNVRVIPVVREFADIQIQTRVTGRVRLEKTVSQYEQAISHDLTSETIAIEHVSINKYVDEPVLSRQEGDVTIIPVMEEIVITRKQLVLKEEIRITRNRTTTQHQEVIPLRTEDLRVIRLAPDPVEG